MENPVKFKEEESNIKDILVLYLRYWPLILIFLFISLSIAYIYLRYASPSFKTDSFLLIKDDNNSSISELAAFEDLGITGSSLNKSSFENELAILKSKKILRNVVTELNLNTVYIREGKIKKSELYLKKPFFFNLIQSDSASTSAVFYVKLISNDLFQIKQGAESDYNKYKFGEKIKTNFGSVFLTPNLKEINNFKKGGEEEIIVVIRTVQSATDALQRALIVQPVSDFSSVINLSLIANNSRKSEDILNVLANVYNEDAINDRNSISKNTADFIDKRLKIITQELDSVESNDVIFRKENGLTDIRTESQISLENFNLTKKNQLEISTKISLYKSMQEYLNSGNDTELLPQNLSIESEGISKAISEFNLLVKEKQRILQNATPSNPVVQTLNIQINASKENILQNLNTIINTLSLQRNRLNTQINNINSELSKIPTISKEYRGIERQQSTKESLYLYLLQKREETAISMAVASPKAKVIDYAYSSKSPIAPNRKNILFIAFAIGILIPVVSIYFKNLLDTKIHNRSDVDQQLPRMPILGEIPILESKDPETIKNNDRSVLAESFRILRTNLNYFIKGNQNGNVIFVTSTIKGEGKTFVAYNLAITLRSTGKSVLLIGADIRNPQIHRYIDKNEWTIGLSEYLFDTSVEISSITNKTDTGGQEFDVILSGRIPPNPAELLMSDRFEHIIGEVREKYDYVIVDTAPTLLVTDTLLISQLADTTVYVCRAEYTDKKLLQYPKELYEDGKLKNIAFAINGIKMTNFGYGSKYGYGYGYGQEQPSVYSRVKKLFRFRM